MAVLAGSLFGQGNSGNAPGRLSLPEDWSDQHVVFSPPRSPQAAAAAQKDPRYLHQVLRHNTASTNQGSKTKTPPPPPPAPTGDWSVSMGRPGSTMAPIMFPAKYTFDVNQAPSCSNDFAVFASDQSALARATGTVVLGPQIADGDTLTITGSTARTYTFRSSPVSAGDVRITLQSNNPDQDATGANLVAAINGTGTPGTDYGSGTAINAAVSAQLHEFGITTGEVDLTARAPGTGGNSITVTKGPGIPSNHINILTSPLSGGSNTGAQSTILATNNLYSGGTDVAASATGTFSGNADSTGNVTITNPNGTSITLTPNVTVAATGSGTFSTNTVNNAETATITNPNLSTSLILTASGPVAASRTGSFSAPPTSTTNSIIAGSVTLKTNGTAETVAGTFASAPASATSITIANSANSNTLALTTNATTASSTGTFSNPPLSNTSLTVTNSAVSPSTTLTLTNNGTGSNATGTFAGPPLSSTSVAINSGSNTLTMTPAGTGRSAIGTFANSPAANTSVTINSGSNTLGLTTNATAGSATGTFTAPPTAGSITITNSSNPAANTLTLITNATAAKATGTFSNPPSATTSLSVTSGSNTLALMTNATPGSVIGTFGGAIGSTGSIAITNSSNPLGSNTLALTNNGTGAHALGTFSAPPSSATSVSINSGSNSLTLTTNATTTVATVQFTGTPGGGMLVLTNGTTNTLNLSPGGSNGCSSATAGTVVVGGSNATEANNLRDAINNCNTAFGAVGFTATSNAVDTTTITASKPGAFATVTTSGNFNHINLGGSTGNNGTQACTGSSPTFTGTFITSSSTTTLATNLAAAINACPAAAGVSASPSGSGVTVTDTTPGSFTTFSVGATNNASIFSWGVVIAGTDGTQTCPSSTSGTFINSSTTSGLATNLAAAINACNTAFPSTVGVTASPSGSTVVVTDSTPGAFLSVGDTMAGFSWGSVTGNSNGSATCSNSTTGTFITSSSTTTLATNLRDAINACNTAFAAVGATATASGATVTVTDTTIGNMTFSVGAANNASIFSWGAVTPGSNGTQTCPSATSGTFITDSSTTTLAGNVAAAINACNTAFSAVGVTASASTNTVTLTDTKPGNFLSVGNSLTGFSWTSTTAGDNGSATCPSSTTGTFATSSSTTTLALNLRDAINACNTAFSAVGTTASASAATVTATDTTPGTFTTFVVGASNNTSIFSWGAVSAGSNGAANTCPGATSGTFITDSSTTTLAANLAAAINLCPVAAGVTASPSANTVTVTDRTPGSFTTFLVTATNNASIFSWSGVTAGTNGSNSCGSATSGTFATDASTTNLAANVAAAIGLCPAAVGVTASPSTNTVTVTQTKPGPFLAVGTTNNTGIFSWAAVSGGLPGSNTCPSATTGTYATSSSPTTLASNLAAAITLCPTTAGVTAGSGGSTTTITARTPGSLNTISGASNDTSIFSWAAPTNGTDGTNTCLTLSTATFATSSDTTTLASNLKTAINACSGANVTASSSTNTVTVTAVTAGTGGNGIGTTSTLAGFTWGGATLTGGTNGDNTGTNFIYWSGSSPVTSAQLATNFTAAINRAGNGSSVGVSATSTGSSGVVTLTATDPGAAGNNITLAKTLSGFTWSTATLTGGSGSNTGLFFATSSNTTTEASNLTAAINRNNTNLGVAASSSTNVVTVTATTVGTAGNLIMLSDTAPGFAWSSPNLQNGNSAGICLGGAPTVMFAYNTQSTAPAAGAITTSPVLSYDGTRIAFVENVFGGPVLHVLRWKPSATTTPDGTVLSPVTPTAATTSGPWTTCLAGSTSCLFNLTYGTSNGNTYSSPFYNYTADTLYVGDDGGVLSKFTGVLNGTPALAWSVTVNTGHRLTSPVFDSGTNRIIVADDSGRVSVVTDSGVTGLLGLNTISGLINITDGPILDGSTGKILVFSGTNGTNAVVVQDDTTLLGVNRVITPVGNASSTQIHAGTFDNNFFNGAAGSGHLYVCGKASTTDNPVLYRINLDLNGKLSSTTDGNSLPLTTATTAAECSPVSEIFNTGGPGTTDNRDWLFVGVPSNCAFGGASTGCVMTLDATNGFPTAGASFTGAETGGTSGIIVDNTSVTGQTSSLYFSTLSNATCSDGISTGGCAVKRTQAGQQ